MNREAKHILELVIKPVLPLVGMDSESAQLLMVYTGEVESGYDNLRQVLPSGNYGPAYGFWQMQENAYVQCVKYLGRNLNLKNRILSACYFDVLPPFESLIWNVRFAMLMARVQYWQVEAPLPKPDDLEGLGAYYLKYYNRGGAGSVKRFVEVCRGLLD